MRRIQDERFVCLYGLDTEEYPELAYIEDEIKHAPKYDNGIVNWVVGEMKRSGVCKDYADRVGEYNQPSYMQKMWSDDDKYLMYFDGMGTVEIWGDEYPVSDYADSSVISDSYDNGFYPYIVFEDGEVVEEFYLEEDAIDFAKNLLILDVENGRKPIVNVDRCDNVGGYEETVWSSENEFGF